MEPRRAFKAAYYWEMKRQSWKPGQYGHKNHVFKKDLHVTPFQKLVKCQVLHHLDYQQKCFLAIVSITTVKRSIVHENTWSHTHYKSDRRLYFSKWLRTLIFRNFSKVLLTTERFLTGMGEEGVLVSQRPLAKILKYRNDR